jgi:transposase
MPIFNLMEGLFEMVLVNAQHMKAVPGRKTDTKDAEWIADLLQHGLLKASFIPPQPQRDLRDLTRYRTNLKQERTRHVNRIHKLLEETNIKLSSIFGDLMCQTGRACGPGVGASSSQTGRPGSCPARMYESASPLSLAGVVGDGPNA